MSNTKKKILYIITQTEWGGAQKYVYELATSPEALNYDISVAVGKNQDRTLIDKLRAKNIEVIELKHLVRPISPIQDVLAIFELKRLFKNLKPDVIHTNSSMPSVLGAYAFKLSGLKNTKLIHTVHGWAFNENISFLKKRIYLITEKLTAKYKSSFIFLSEYDIKSAKKNKLKINNSVIIYNGINANELNLLNQDTAREKLKLPTNKTVIGTVANFYPTKGLEYFIKAISKLNNPKIIGVIIGDGDLRNDLEKLIANLNLKNNFLLLGKYDKASQYLNAFDIYVSTSTKEGLPYSILEAMSANCPIIATNVGGIPEIISDKNGILIEDKDYNLLAEKIKYLIDNKQLAKELSEQAEIDVIEKFSKEKMIENTFNQY